MKTKHLMFSRKYLDLLLSDKKHVTIRAKNPGVKPGDKVLVHCGGLVLGLAVIKSVRRKKVKDLGEEEALMDGFSDRKELVATLKKHYPWLGENSLVYIVEFEWHRRFDTPISDQDYSWKYRETPQEVASLALKHLLDLDEYEREILRLVAKEGSIRKAAIKMGGLKNRIFIRGVLRKVALRLEERGILSTKS